MTDLEHQNTKLGDLNYYFAYNAAPIQNNKQVSNTCKYHEFHACLLGKECDSILVYLLGSLEQHACKYLILACLLRSVVTRRQAHRNMLLKLISFVMAQTQQASFA
jgi:hypothetical protein